MSRYRICLTLLTTIAGLAGCAATTDLSAPHARADYAVTSPDSVGAPLSTTVRPQLMLASRGLLYTSGSDYPFVYFRRAVVNRAATTSLSIAEFRTLLGLDNDPFTGTALPTSLLGAQGVFGSLVPILRMTVTAR